VLIDLTVLRFAPCSSVDPRAVQRREMHLDGWMSQVS
jgi:hypothetical protein